MDTPTVIRAYGQRYVRASGWSQQADTIHSFLQHAGIESVGLIEDKRTYWQVSVPTATIAKAKEMLERLEGYGFWQQPDADDGIRTVLYFRLPRR
jgi:hypothetical protein